MNLVATPRLLPDGEPVLALVFGGTTAQVVLTKRQVSQVAAVCNDYAKLFQSLQDSGTPLETVFIKGSESCLPVEMLSDAE